MVRFSKETWSASINNDATTIHAQELVSVQPMDGPVGLIFYFDPSKKVA
jgi:hypothetical protein